jgi:glycosyltransferase involved in cell wall biosynthesis
MPVRDGAAHLPSALRSLLRQEFRDFEVLVQDDGSRDDSPRIAREFARRDPRVRGEALPARGVVAALEAACRRARGALWVRMDADDLSAPTRLARLLAAAESEPEVGLLASGVRYAPRARLGEGMRRYEEWVSRPRSDEEIRAERFVECPLVHGAWALRPATWRALGGYREGPFPEDYDLLLRAADAGVRFLGLGDPLLTVRLAEGTLSRRDDRYGEEAFRSLKRRHLLPLLARETRPLYVVGAGPNGKRWARDLANAGASVAGFVDPRPGRPGQSIAGLRVYAPGDLPPPDRSFLLVAVGQAGRRDGIGAALERVGRRAGADWLALQ